MCHRRPCPSCTFQCCRPWEAIAAAAQDTAGKWSSPEIDRRALWRTSPAALGLEVKHSTPGQHRFPTGQLRRVYRRRPIRIPGRLRPSQTQRARNGRYRWSGRTKGLHVRERGATHATNWPKSRRCRVKIVACTQWRDRR
eukprot:7380784-Prymnesium_polylepis.7